MAIALSQIRIEADLDASKYVAGAKAKADADAKMVDGAEKVTTAIDVTERRLGTSGSAYEKLARSIDPAYLAQKRLEAGAATLQRAVDAGTISTERQTQLLDLLQKRYGELNNGLIPANQNFKTNTAVVNDTSEAHARLSGQAQSALHSIRSMAEQVLLGVSPFQILTQQISHLTYAASGTGGLTGAFSEAASILTKLITPTTLVIGAFGAAAAAVAVLGYRFLTTQDQINRFSLTLDALGKGGQASGAQLQTAFEHIRDSGSSAADALTAIQSISRNPLINQGRAEELVALARDIGTITGEALPAATDKLTAAITGGTDGIIKYAFSLNALGAEEAKQIRQTGDLNIAVDAIHKHYDDAQEKALTPFGRAVRDLSARWQEFIDTLSRGGVFTFVFDQLTKMISDVNELIRSIKELIENFKHLRDSLAQGGPIVGSEQLAKTLQKNTGMTDAQIQAALPGTGGPSATAVLPEIGALSYASPAEQATLAQIRQNENAGGNPYLLHYPAAGQSETVSSLADVITSQVLKNSHAFGLYGFQPGTYRQVAGSIGANPQDISPDAQNYVALQALRTWGPNASQTWGASGIAQGRPYSTAGLEFGGQQQPGQALGAQEQTDIINKQTEAFSRSNEALKQRGALTQAITAYNEAFYSKEGESLSLDNRKLLATNAYNQALVAAGIEQTKATDESNRLAAATLDVANAFGKSEADGIRAKAALEATTQVLDKFGASAENGARIQQATTAILAQQAAAAISAAEQQSRALDNTVAANKRLADASANGTAAARDAQIHNEALAQTYNAVNEAQALYEHALTTGNRTLIESTKAEYEHAQSLTKSKEEQLKLIEASRETVQVNQNITQLKDAGALLELQVGLQGKTTEEIQGQVLLLQTQQKIKNDLSLADKDRAAALVQQTETYVQQNIKIAEARAAQQRLDEEVRSIADTVANTLGTAIDDVLSGKKIQDWGALFKDMLRQIASTIIQSELIKPLIGSVLQSAGLTQAAQQYGTLGQGGGLLSGGVGGSSVLGNVGSVLGGIGKLAGLGGETGSGGILSGIGSLFGGGAAASALPGEAVLLAAEPTAAIGGVVSSTALTAGAADAAAGAGGLLGGLGGAAGIAGLAASAIPIAGAVIAGVTLLTSILGNKKPSNNAGGLVLDLSSGQTSGASGSSANLGVAKEIGSSLATFEQQLLAKIPGATLPGGSVNIAKGDLTGITGEYSGPLGHIKSSFSSAQDAINAFSVAIAKDLGGVSDTLKQTLSTITDPSQIQAAIDVANAYDKVKDSASGAATELSGAYDDIFKNVTADTIRSVGPFENVLNQINARFNQLTQSASQYGLSLDPINVGYKAAKDRLASDFNATIAQALQALQDPAQAAVEAEKKAGDQRVTDAKAVGADLVALENYNSANLKKYTDAVTKEAADATKAAADATKAAADATKAAADFAQSVGPSFHSIVASLGDQTGPFEKAFTAINDNLAKLTDTATAAGYATDDIARTADQARQGVTGAFNTNISSLLQSITDPVQQAIDVEKAAGQQRVRDAFVVSGDLDAVNRYNTANLERVTVAARNSLNSLASAQQILRGAADTLNASISSVTASTKGPFAQALDALSASLVTLTNALAAASNTAADATPLLADFNRAFETLRQSFNENIQNLTLGLTDPFQAALNVELAAGRRRVADAIAVAGDLNAVDEYNRRNLLAVARAAASATEALATAAGYNRDIQQQILEITDPLQAALNAEIAAGAARVAAAQQVGADLAQVDELNRLKLIAVGDATIRSADALDAFTGRLQSLEGALNQLTSGPLSGLTPAAQVNAATANFQTLLERVKGGNLDLIPDLTAAGTSAVEASQEAYGNAKKTADLRARITSSLQDVAAQTGREALAAAASVTVTAANQAQVSAAEKAQATSARRIADSAAAQSTAEQARTGVENQLLRDQAAAAKKIADQLSNQAEAQTQISQVDVARTKVANALLQQEAAAAARAAGAAAANVGTPEQQAAYQAAAQQQAASVAARVEQYQQADVAAAAAQQDFFARQSQQSQQAQLNVADQQKSQEAAGAIAQFISGNPEIGKILAQLVRVGTIEQNSESQDYLARNFEQYARNFAQSFAAQYPDFSLSEMLGAQGFARGTSNTPAGWIRVGEQGPELIHQGGGDIVLPNGVLPSAINDNSAATELRAVREELAALRRQIQGGQALASRDAKAIVGETANVGRAIARSPASRRVVA